MKRFSIQEFVLLSLPIVLIAAFPIARRVMPPQELRTDSCQILPPTTLERYMGYDSAIEIRTSAPLRNTQRWEYEITDGKGKKWSWEEPAHLELFAGGMVSPNENFYSSRSLYRRAMHGKRVFNGADPVTLTWYERKDRNDEVVKRNQQVQVDLPDFQLPVLQKPSETPYKITKIELENEMYPNSIGNLGEAKVRCWLEGKSKPSRISFLRGWSFLHGNSIVRSSSGGFSQFGVDKSGISKAEAGFVYDYSKSSNRLKGFLSMDEGWPLEVTAELPLGWEKSKKPLLLKFDFRIADFPTAQQLDQMNNWWPKKAK